MELEDVPEVELDGRLDDVLAEFAGAPEVRPDDWFEYDLGVEVVPVAELVGRPDDVLVELAGVPAERPDDVVVPDF